ncbi:MAG: 50S ribosomal protein L23 [Bacteroidetes bacterium]|jgi:large subunit ribosomal protein L23|nr:50S ribosomal protein L23 [Bacteroidota bacterium]MCL5034034.1 50S ribosomal protein L23 [Bacteroidota bacterium]
MSAVIIRPLLTEKNTKLQEQHQYVFEVVRSSNKIEIAREIEKRFNVKVKSIRTVVVEGKMIGTLTKRGKFEGRRPERKKAIVTLMEGYTIDLLGAA